MYRFKSAMHLFTTTAFPTSTFSHSSALFGSLASRRCHGGSVGRKILPPEFSRNVVRLTCESTAKGGVCEVYVVGTIHDYPVLFLELCSSRTDGILYPPKVHTWRLGNKLCKITFLKDQVDSEFRIAFKEANKFGAKVILGDRPLKVTVMRYHDKFCRMPWLAMKIKIKKALNEDDNEDDLYKRTLTPDDVVYQLDPIYTEVVTYERDQYMSAKLLEVARKHSSIVAVVGKAHLLGIQKYWKLPVEVKQLLSVPRACHNRMIAGALAIFLATLQYYFKLF